MWGQGTIPGECPEETHPKASVALTEDLGMQTILEIAFGGAAIGASPLKPYLPLGSVPASKSVAW